MPTREDASQNGNVLVADETKSFFEKWDHVPGTTWPYWYPLPPLPKPVEKTQDEKDKETFFKYWRKTPNAQEIAGRDGEPIFIDGIRYGRSDGRAQLAREALALLSSDLTKLHALLRRAAGETP